MKKTLAVNLLLLLAFVVSIKSQTLSPDEMVICSWQKGADTIKNQSVSILLDNKNNDFKTEIVGDSTRRYILKTVHNPDNRLLGEHWKVELREISYDKETGKEITGENLLNTKQFEPNEFSGRIDYLDYFYPNEGRMIQMNNVPRIAVKTKKKPWYITPFYPLNVIRKFRVENFLVTLHAGNLKLNEDDNNKVDSFEILVNFETVKGPCKATPWIP